MQTFAAADLTGWTASVFAAAGVRREDADETARLLVRTSLRGVDTHGVVRVLAYLEKVLAGELNGAPSPVLQERDGILWLDGDAGLGQAVACQAVREAVARARDTATVTCLIRRSGHLGALGVFVLEAAEQGMIAFMCQETPPVMALEGARKAAIGNNPLAFAAPVTGHTPLVFDMAASVVARGNVLQALRDGDDKLPEGWAIGPDGEATTDPRQALKGAMLPSAGHKGMAAWP